MKILLLSLAQNAVNLGSPRKPLLTLAVIAWAWLVRLANWLGIASADLISKDRNRRKAVYP